MRVNLNISNIDNIEYIVHISDIHIRLLDRHTEYRKVFNDLYEYIKTTPINTIIFLGGDIVHSKLEMSPELIDMISDFFVNLEKIRPVILIKGNHDLNVKNTKRMDVIYPIVKSLNLKNLFYINDFENIYTYKNVDFCLYPFWSVNNPPIHLCEPNNIKIGMYHDALNGSKTAYGHVIEKNNYMDRFEGMDIVLLGDIHYYQVISKDPITVYPGSLIQQDFGEELDNHGIVFWNLKTKEHTFVEIKNKEYGFVNAKLIDGNIIPAIDTINRTYPNVKIFFNESDKLLLSKLKEKIKKEHPNVQSVIFEKIKSKEEKKLIDDINVNKKDTQIDLLKKYFTLNSLDYTNIENIHEKILNLLDEKIKPVNKIWKPIKLKFSNLFSYGENNQIDFENLNGSYGIFAPNASGKSSIMEIINFVCFNKTSYTNQINKIVNTKKNDFLIDFIFEYNNNFYKILRTGTKSKDKFKLETNFYKINPDESILEDLTKGKNDIYKELKEYLGDYNDFVLTALSLQGNRTNFIEKTQSERKELIQQFLELDVFENLYEKANSKSNELKNIISNLNKKYIELSNAKYSEKINDLNIKIKDIISNINEKEELKNNLTIEINNIKEKIVNNISTKDINFIEKQLQISKKEKETFELQINSFQKQIRTLSDTITRLNTSYVNVDSTLFKTNVNVYGQLKKNMDELCTNMRMLTNQLKKYDHLHFNNNCDSCNLNISTLNIDVDKNELLKLEEQKVNLDKEIQDFYLTINFNSFEEYTDFYYLNNDILKQIDKENTNLKKLEFELIQYNSKLEKQNQDILKYEAEIVEAEKNKKIIEENKYYLNELTNFNFKFNTVEKELSNLIENKIEILTNIKNLEYKLEELNKLNLEINTLNTEYVDYVNYSKAMSKNGISLSLINDILSTLELEVNTILENISNFKIIFELIDNNIETYITYNNTDKWDVSTISGMEKFISSLAIRIALINISQLPRPNFICIDEGFGVLDKQNINELKQLFEYFKGIFNFYIVISHIEILRDFVDNSIDIYKEGNFSKIMF